MFLAPMQAWRKGAVLFASCLILAGGSPVAEEPAGTDEPKVVLNGPLDFSEIALLAVQDRGRKKPLQTLAAENIEEITGRPFFLATAYWKDPADKERHSALDVFLSMWLESRSQEEWKKLPIVLVSYLPLRKELKLDEREKRFSLDQIMAAPGIEAGSKEGKATRIEELVAEAHTIRQDKGENHTPELQSQAEIVFTRIQIMRKLLFSDAVTCVPHPTDPDGTWLSLGRLMTFHARPAEEVISGLAAEYTRGDFEAAHKIYSAYSKGYSAEQAREIRDAYNAFRHAYLKREPEAFLQASRELRTLLGAMSPGVYPSQAQLSREVTYNQTRPFGKAWMFYLLALLVGVCSFRSPSKAMYGTVMAIYLAGMAFHVYGFVIRCLIAGRPPVSNMFESVIWVGFGAVLFGLIFELIYRPKYFLLCGAGGGLLCLVLMDMLPAVMGHPSMPGFESNINPLVPVLRDNFWLTIHVLTITLSYAAFLLAWVLGHVTLGKHLIRPLNASENLVMHQFVYRVLQIGVLLLAAGTILGGVWAYYSWGRFWGWDPKETWAFIGLIFYLIVLHGRFTGWWGNYGMCVGSVLGFWPIMMAWYGVNFVLPKLGQGGLHSYGTGSGGESAVVGTALVDILFTVIAVWRFKSAIAAAKPAFEVRVQDAPTEALPQR